MSNSRLRIYLSLPKPSSLLSEACISSIHFLAIRIRRKMELRNVSWVRPPSSNAGFSDSTEVAGTQTRLGRSEPKSGECRLRSCIFRVMLSPQASPEPASTSLSTVAAADSQVCVASEAVP